MKELEGQKGTWRLGGRSPTIPSAQGQQKDWSSIAAWESGCLEGVR